MGTVNPAATVDGLDPATRFISAPRAASRFWESWLREQGIPRVPARRLVGQHQRLVVVAPHPDDEILACGALLCAHLAQGGTCLLVAVTDGEAGTAGTPGHDAVALASQRRQESAAGLQRLGVPTEPAVVRLGLPDGVLQDRAEEVRAQVAALVRPGDVVLTTWRRDGHPDHEACGHACAAVCDASAVTLLEAPVWMWHWAEPWDPQVDWTRLTGVGVDNDTVARKLHALAAHRSQLTSRSPTLPPVLDSALIERAGWDTEYFFAP